LPLLHYFHFIVIIYVQTSHVVLFLHTFSMRWKDSPNTRNTRSNFPLVANLAQLQTNKSWKLAQRSSSDIPTSTEVCYNFRVVFILHGGESFFTWWFLWLMSIETFSATWPATSVGMLHRNHDVKNIPPPCKNQWMMNSLATTFISTSK